MKAGEHSSHMTDVEPRLRGQCVPLTHRKPWLGSWALRKLGSDTDSGSRDRRNRSFNVSRLARTRPAPGLPKTLTPSKQTSRASEMVQQAEAQTWCPAFNSRTHMQKTQTDSQVVLWPPHRLYGLCVCVCARAHTHTHTHTHKNVRLHNTDTHTHTKFKVIFSYIVSLQRV